MSDSLRPHGLYRTWNSPGQNTGVGSCSLLQGIFPTQGLNPGLPHCRRILYQLSHNRSPSQHIIWFSNSTPVCPEKAKSQIWKDICTVMSIAVLFIINKYLTNPSTYQQTTGFRRCGVYTTDYYSAIRKWNMAICSNKDVFREYLTKWNKSDRETNTISLTYGI